MTGKYLLKIAFIALIVTGCGGSPKSREPQTEFVPPEPFLWESGNPIPSWFVDDGQYQSPCLFQPPLIMSDGKPLGNGYSFITTLAFAGSTVGRTTVEFQNGDSNCSKPLRAEGYEVSVDSAWIGDPYMVYSGSKQSQTTVNQVYLSADEADFLNKNKVCGGIWVPDSMNDIMNLDQEACNKEIDAMGTGFDRVQAKLLLGLYKTPESSHVLYLVVRQTNLGLGVKAGSGLIKEPVELLFKSLK